MPADPTKGQEDPYMMLITAGIGMIQNSTQTEVALSGVEQGFAKMSTDSVTEGNKELTAEAKSLSGLTGSALTHEYAKFQTMQPHVSSINQQQDAVGQAGSTQLNQVGEAMQREMQFPQAVLDGMANQAQLTQSVGS